MFKSIYACIALSLSLPLPSFSRRSREMNRNEKIGTTRKFDFGKIYVFSMRKMLYITHIDIEMLGPFAKRLTLLTQASTHSVIWTICRVDLKFTFLLARIHTATKNSYKPIVNRFTKCVCLYDAKVCVLHPVFFFSFSFLLFDYRQNSCTSYK